jgi:hypothetical protein
MRAPQARAQKFHPTYWGTEISQPPNGLGGTIHRDTPNILWVATNMTQNLFDSLNHHG